MQSIQSKEDFMMTDDFLAQPEPQRPSDQELYDYWISTSPEFGCADPVGFARAVLARWARTTIEPASLVERVSDALMESVKDQGSMARAAILAIAAEVEYRGDKGLDLDPGETADWLRQEAGND
jgi:hypothetical protein